MTWIDPKTCKHLGEFTVQRNHGVRQITCERCMEEFIASWVVEKVTDALDIAENAIINAPHASHCDAAASVFPGPCSCWKQKTLYKIDEIKYGPREEKDDDG